MKYVLVSLVAIAFTYLLVLLYVYLQQRKFQYFPTHNDSKGEGNRTFSRFESGGQFLGYFKEGREARSVILVFHGNGGEALDRSWYQELIGETAHLVLVEYPGYGGSEGKISEESLFARAKDAFDASRERWGFPVGVIGESLGTGVASHLASQRNLSWLALVAPFTSALEVAKLRFPYLPIEWLMHDKYRSDQALKGVKIPLHVIHGTLDDVIPMSLGKTLFESYEGSPKAFSELPGFAHNGLSSGILDSPYAERFRSFVLQ